MLLRKFKVVNRRRSQKECLGEVRIGVFAPGTVCAQAGERTNERPVV